MTAVFLLLALPATCGLAYLAACAWISLEERREARFWRGVARGVEQARRADR